MAEARLSDEESQVLRMVLAVLAVKSRTGEVGIRHGLDRFVSTNLTLKKSERELLDSVAKKVGLAGGISSS